MSSIPSVSASSEAVFHPNPIETGANIGQNIGNLIGRIVTIFLRTEHYVLKNILENIGSDTPLSQICNENTANRLAQFVFVASCAFNIYQTPMWLLGMGVSCFLTKRAHEQAEVSTTEELPLGMNKNDFFLAAQAMALSFFFVNNLIFLVSSGILAGNQGFKLGLYHWTQWKASQGEAEGTSAQACAQPREKTA